MKHCTKVTSSDRSRKKLSNDTIVRSKTFFLRGNVFYVEGNSTVHPHPDRKGLGDLNQLRAIYNERRLCTDNNEDHS
jgi:hypothetical protein